MGHLAHSRVLEEYDRPRPKEVRVTREMQSLIRSRLKELAGGNMHWRSLSDEDFAFFGSSAFETVSAEAFRHQGLATISLLHAAADLTKLKKSWMNLMLSRGALLHQVGSLNAWVVAGASELGVVGVRVYAVRDKLGGGGDLSWISLVPVAGIHDDVADRFALLRIDDLAAWRASDVEIVPNGAYAHTLAAGSHAFGRDFVVRPVAPRMLLHWSAHRAFKGLSTAR
ncbi:unnamed protein product [Prorocentrum cordatum]|uniref:Uncharacterized protein n=1 Tax=Prorocentrum cordatum TaxID=2364126 RepID=A0ABN9Q4H4_9DINO|nr:unnamed protein product [Polarella glacialis]